MASTSTPAAPSKKARLTMNLASVEQQLDYLRQVRGRPSLLRGEKLDILFVYFSLYREAFLCNTSSDLINAIKRTAVLLGRGKGTVSKVVKSWSDAIALGTNSIPELKNSISSTQRMGNTTVHSTRIPSAQSVYIQVRDFVRAKRSKFEHVTAHEVLQFMEMRNIVSMHRDDEGNISQKDMKSALRTTQRWLSSKGFKRGAKSGSIGLKPHIVAWRNSYLRKVLSNRSLPESVRYQEVYLDESYIHLHYCRYENSLYDPNDEQDEQIRKPNKGKRICFLSAIKYQCGSHRSGLVENSVWYFVPSAAKNQVGDYHKALNGSNFLTWFKNKLLPNLSRPSMIILDNAAYHKCLPEEFQNISKLRKADILLKLRSTDTVVPEGITAIEARQLLKNWIQGNIKPEIETIAEAEGHCVLFTPPYHSDLQPIELLWAFIKGNIGRSYTVGTTLHDVETKLEEQFRLLRSETGDVLIQCMVESVDKIIAKFSAEILEEEDIITGSEGSDGATNESDSDLSS